MSKNNTPNIEDKITALEAMVAWFDSEDFVLEQALVKYQEAEKLGVEIQKDITSLKNSIEQVGGKIE